MTMFEEKMKYYSFILAIIGVTTVFVYFLTSLESYSLGFLIGIISGYVNLWTIYHKTVVVGRAANKQINQSVFSVFALIWAGLGFVVRISIALLAIWLAILYPEYIHLISVIAGFSLIYIIILIDMICQFIRRGGMK